ncbi:MAG: sugar-binding domain-containing protein [Gemmatimonadaceae bacterium]
MVQRLVAGSCAMFDADSPYARVLGQEITDFLVEENVMGDFLGVFITPDGRTVQPYTKQMIASHIMSADLARFGQRDDALVVMACGGGQKVRLMRAALELKMCNALITDDRTARALL